MTTPLNSWGAVLFICTELFGDALFLIKSLNDVPEAHAPGQHEKALAKSGTKVH